VGRKGVVLAAGYGTRLRPLTDRVPKALLRVGGVALVDRAMTLLAPHVDAVAVNASHHADQVVAHVGDRAHVSVEAPTPFGTAGALHALCEWIGDDDVLVHNADSIILGDVTAFVDGWDGEHVALLVHQDAARVDFAPWWRFSGLSWLPNRLLATLPPPPSDLYASVWRPLHAEGRLHLVPLDGTAIDCGTPADYAAANVLLGGAGERFVSQ
jgi:NDP-sugar pyrophosphorylase family protein